ncbi:MAG: HAD family phosphatase [Planctomycetes bacterium]|nr:HAD family phosphatase [Planctomycetota bacterium]
MELIDALWERFKLGLVSGADLKRLTKTVPDDFFRRFKAVISGDKVNNPKPHPEPYIAAAKELFVPPLECLVVENAPLGIESAKRAGMRCIAVCSTLKRNLISDADFIVDDINALWAFFDYIID